MIGSLCGVWVDEAGRVHTTVAAAGGGRETKIEAFRPFAWLNDTPPDANLHGLTLERLQGPGPYDRLVHAESLGVFETFTKEAKQTAIGIDAIVTVDLYPRPSSTTEASPVVAAMSLQPTSANRTVLQLASSAALAWSPNDNRAVATTVIVLNFMVGP